MGQKNEKETRRHRDLVDRKLLLSLMSCKNFQSDGKNLNVWVEGEIGGRNGDGRSMLSVAGYLLPSTTWR